MAVDDRLSDLLLEWDEARMTGAEPSLEDLCRETPELLLVVKESIESLKATEWMFASQGNALPALEGAGRDAQAALHDTALPASHLTVAEFAASIYQSGLLSQEEIDELKQRIETSDLPGEAREVASKLVDEGKLTRYQASVLLKASKDPLLVDNYVILDTLDTGGMGLVFKAVHRSMDRVVALKLLPASMMSARDTVKRFQREVKAAAALQHPNIVAAYDADESKEIAYLVLEFVEGTNLFRWVKEHGPLSVAHAADCIRQAASGLAYLHARGIIHRDVKPANLILANDGTVKLLDMGLVRFASSEDLSCAEMDQELTQAGIVIGTVAYMSPEQALDTRSADQRSDVYSLGCTLFFLLTGRSIYHEETGMKTLLAHREQSVPSIRQFREDVPVSLDSVFRTMVAKRPGDRMQNMSEVIAAIDEFRSQLSTVSPAGTSFCEPSSVSRPMSVYAPRKWSRFLSKRQLIAATLAATVGLIVLTAVIVIRIKTDNGRTSVTLETEPDGPAAETKKVLGDAGHTGLKSPEPSAAPVSGGTDLLEVPLGPFQSPKQSWTNDTKTPTTWVSFSLVAIVQPQDLARMRFDKETRGARITGAVHEAVRLTSSHDLYDRESTQLKANLKKQINAVLREPYVQEIIIQGWNLPRFWQIPGVQDSGASDMPRAQSSGGTDLVEVPLGQFTAQKRSDAEWMSLNLVAAVQSRDLARMKADKDTHQARITAAVRDAVRSTSSDDLDDPELKQFKANLKTQINAVLPAPYVHQILVPNYIPSGRARGSRDKLPRNGSAASGKSNERIEYDLANFRAPLAWDGAPMEAEVSLLAVINPDVEETFSRLVGVTYDGRIREAVVSVLHKLTVAEARDPDYKQLKASLLKAINDVLPEPYIHQIVVKEFEVTAQSADKHGNDHQKAKRAKGPKSNTSDLPSPKDAAQENATKKSKSSTIAPKGADNTTGH